MPQDYHFTLVGRKQVQHPADPVMALTLHEFLIDPVLGYVYPVEDIVVFRSPYRRGALHFPEMIDAEVVGYTHCPREEFPFLGVPAIPNSIDHPNENILYDILGKVLVLYQQNDGGEDLFLVAVEDGLERLGIAVHEDMDQLLIGEVGERTHCFCGF
jgi:hypothetical protein